MSDCSVTIDLFAEELEKESRWYDLGVFLGVQTFKLDAIRETCGFLGTQRCLIEVFKCLCSQFPNQNITWKNVTRALTRMGNVSLAEALQLKYDRQSSEKPEIIVEWGVVDRLRVLVVKFARVVMQFRQTLLAKCISIDILQLAIQEICQMEPLFSEVITYDRVFSRLHQHYCFLNFHVLLSLFDMFLIDEIALGNFFKEYSADLQAFKSSVLISELMGNIKQVCGAQEAGGNRMTVLLKLQGYWGSVTMQRFERFATLVFREIYNHFVNVQVEDGCICITWLFCSLYKDQIVSIISQTTQKNFLSSIGVLMLSIESENFFTASNTDPIESIDAAFQKVLDEGNVEAIELFLAVGCSPSTTAAQSKKKAISIARQLQTSDRKTVLYFACLNGHGDVVERLIDSRVPIVRTSLNWTPHLAACVNGHNDILELLLRVTFLPQEDLKHALYIACQNGYAEIVAMLLNYLKESGGGEISTSTLVVASCNGHEKVVEQLLDVGINPNSCTEDGISPLFTACQSEYPRIVSFLLDNGAVPTSECIFASCQSGNNAILQMLLLASKKFVNIFTSKEKATPLFIASQEGHLSAVETLLNFGGNPNMSTRKRWTPLMIASQNGHKKIVELLLQAQVNPNTRNRNNATALYIASQNGYREIVSTLIKFGGDPKLAKFDGWTPLHISSLKGHIEVVRVLLGAAVGTNQRTEDGETSILVASQNGHLDVVATLTEAGGDPTILDYEKWTPLMIASQNGHIKVVSLLLNEDVDVNAQAKDGRTAVYIACENGHFGIVDILLKAKANINLGMYRTGTTPLEISVLKGYTDISNILLKHERKYKLSHMQRHSLTLSTSHLQDLLTIKDTVLV